MQAIEYKAKIIELNICEQIFKFINENLIDNLNFIEKKNKFKVNLVSSNNMIISDYKIEFRNKTKKIIKVIENIAKLENFRDENNELNFDQNKQLKTFKKRKFKKKKFYKKKTK